MSHEPNESFGPFFRAGRANTLRICRTYVARGFLIKRRWRVRVITSLAFALALPCIAIADEVRKPRVLVVYSHDRLLPVNVRMDEGFRRAMSQGGDARYELFTEYLDIARFSSREQQDSFAAYLQARYVERQPDIVVAIADHSFNFFSARRAVLFPKSPLVFIAITNALLPQARAVEGTTGFPVSLRGAQTLDAMLAMRPGIREVIVISGASPTDRLWDPIIEEEQKRLAEKVQITYWPGRPLSEVMQKVRTLPGDTAILLLSYGRDPDGTAVTGVYVTEKLTGVASVPAFIPYETSVGAGAVGGYSPSFNEYGAAAERIVSRLLTGETPQQIGVLSPPEARYVFDARQLARWKISRSTVPRQSEIWFDQKSLWQEHPRVITGIAIALLLQSGLITGLILQKKRRRKMQQALDVSEDRFEKAFRAGPDAISISRLSDGTLLDVNEQWEALFGHRRNDAIGRSAFHLGLWVNASDRDGIVARVKQGPVRDFETSLRNKAGEVVPVLFSADVVEMAGEPSLVVIARDLRDRRRAEDAARDLIRSSRLAALGELTASLAHELNQPLTAIASNAAAGRRFLERGSDDDAMLRELFQDVGSDARRAGEIIHGIHNLVRRNDESRELVNLNDVITDVLRLLHSDFVGRGISARTHFGRALPSVAADPVHLQQVLLNLLLNSLEAMQSTPAAKRWVAISTKVEQNSFVRLSVTDHGVGLPPENPEKIFEKFYSTKPDGMGMGLMIVRSIVEAHGGELIAENTGHGARFSFRLPVAAVSPKEELA
jgi:PAS domain S-box-containing protein